MLIKKVVVDASPFILLCKCDLIGLLPQIFSQIEMPDAVAQEIIRGNDLASQYLFNFEKDWLTRRQADPVSEVLVWNLGDGETEVLSLAFEDKETIALVDERAARRCADTLGVRTLGTGGLLIAAKRRSLISSVESELDKLENAGLYLSDDLRIIILAEANELS